MTKRTVCDLLSCPTEILTDFDKTLVHRAEIFFPKLGNIANPLKTAFKVWLFLAANSNSVIVPFLFLAPQIVNMHSLKESKCVGWEGASGAGGVINKKKFKRCIIRHEFAAKNSQTLDAIFKRLAMFPSFGKKISDLWTIKGLSKSVKISVGHEMCPN